MSEIIIFGSQSGGEPHAYNAVVHIKSLFETKGVDNYKDIMRSSDQQLAVFLGRSRS